MRLKHASGVGRSAISTTVAPTDSGNVSALPSPYAKNSFAAEKARRPRSGRAPASRTARRSSRGCRAHARCPSAGRSSPTNRARTRRRRRRRRRLSRSALVRASQLVEGDLRRRRQPGVGAARRSSVATSWSASRHRVVADTGSKRGRHHRGLRAAVSRAVRVVGGGQHRVDRDRHDAGIQRAEEASPASRCSRASATARGLRAGARSAQRRREAARALARARRRSCGRGRRRYAALPARPAFDANRCRRS